MTQKLEKMLDQLVKLHPKYIDLSLERLLKLLNKLGNPHLKLPPVVHIAGTNGKGSSLSYIRHILQENNFLVHCYISPHLKSIEERFIISNRQIGKLKLLNALKYVKKINNDKPITFFEITTATAFYIFSKTKADFALIETGLGGRLDATNVIKQAIINVFTPISIDHSEFLGNNLKKIVNEKLGIIKSSSTIISSKQILTVQNHIKKRTKKLKNKKLFYDEHFKIINKDDESFWLKYKNKILKLNKPSLNGEHQIENAATAICAIMQIKDFGYKISKKSINEGLKKTTWPGRLEKGALKNITVYLDGAHNIEAAEKIANYFVNNSINRWLILGMLNNKDLKNYLLKLKKIVTGVIAIKIPGEKNSFLSHEIARTCKKINIRCVQKKSINETNKYLTNVIKPQEIIISGSLYLVGKIRNLYV